MLTIMEESLIPSPLQAYIDEYAWRYNNRKYQDKMFERLLSEIANVKFISPATIRP